ncbi:flavin reductase family protein [Rhodococcus sp. MEB064]|uniref:flavin reductase family protein n=1 Tax=Rhodococcus sp. MEB064 TaxID=1587522 RepID=UPI0005AC4F80|nr:flavin reductase family protein [Rhodococcus sp. MEB064]KIQ14162.1 oxidoreductase [Rhodococcus sp. MEB064]
MKSLDGIELRRAFADIPSGVVAICGYTGSEKIGMVASTFVPVSLDPPLVAFFVQNSSTTWPKLSAIPRLGISVLNAGHHAVVRTLAAKTGDRFSGVSTTEHSGGALLVSKASLSMNVSIDSETTAGDHTIVVMRIHDITSTPHEAADYLDPLVFHRSSFRALAEQ